MSDTTIFHNPGCSQSRYALATLRAAGLQPRVVEYLKTPPSRAEVMALVTAAGLTLHAALREKNTPYAELGLGDPTLSDEVLLDAIEQHPVLLQRPFVVTPLGTALCRPKEKVLELLTPAQRAAVAAATGG